VSGGDVWIIVAMARNGVIGSAGRIPWHLPSDLKRFRTLTLGKPVIMGRLTFESIGGPLVDRDNIVLTRSHTDMPGATPASSIDHALALARSSRESGPGGIAVIGGSAVYEQFLDLASRIELTLVDAEPRGDPRFPDLDLKEWRHTASVEGLGRPRHKFVTLQRRASR
jgi:dihydrofolate reductase